MGRTVSPSALWPTAAERKQSDKLYARWLRDDMKTRAVLNAKMPAVLRAIAASGDTDLVKHMSKVVRALRKASPCDRRSVLALMRSLIGGAA